MEPIGNVHFVPWTDVAEWMTVREKLLSTNTKDIVEAYNIILVWKARFPSRIPAYIEATSGLLQVMIQEYNSDSSEDFILSKELELRLAYSTALTRFVNHVLSISLTKNNSLYVTARINNIPDWIVNLRHDVSHSQVLPPIDLLHSAANHCLNWLLDNYWLNEDNYMTDFLADEDEGNNSSEDEEESKEEIGDSIGGDCISKKINDKLTIKLILKEAVQLWKIMVEIGKENLSYTKDIVKETRLRLEKFHISWKSHFVLCNISAQQMRILEKELEEWKQIKSKKPKKQRTLNTQPITRALLNFINSVSHSKRFRNLAVPAVLESDFLSGVDNPEPWNVILKILHNAKLLGLFIESLLRMVANNDDKLARDWLVFLTPSLKALKNRWENFQDLKRVGGYLKTTNVLKAKAVEMDANEYPDSIIEFNIEEPPKLGLETIRKLLMKPNSSSRRITYSYVTFVYPPLSPYAVNALKNLVKIYCGKTVEDSDFGKSEENFFTLEDLVTRDKTEVEDDVIVSGEKVELSSGFNYDETSDGDVWSSGNIDVEIWSKFPIGILPHCPSSQCELPSGLKWKTRANRKRSSIPLISHASNMKNLKLTAKTTAE